MLEDSKIYWHTMSPLCSRTGKYQNNPGDSGPSFQHPDSRVSCHNNWNREELKIYQGKTIMTSSKIIKLKFIPASVYLFTFVSFRMKPRVIWVCPTSFECALLSLFTFYQKLQAILLLLSSQKWEILLESDQNNVLFKNLAFCSFLALLS